MPTIETYRKQAKLLLCRCRDGEVLLCAAAAGFAHSFAEGVRALRQRFRIALEMLKNSQRAV